MNNAVQLSLIFTILLSLSSTTITFGSVEGVYPNFTVEPAQKGLALVPDLILRKSKVNTVFDDKDTRPLPPEDNVPLNESGVPDFAVSSYAVAYPGARAPQVFHRYKGGLNETSLGVLLKVLLKDAKKKDITIPSKLLNLVDRYPELRIAELNRSSEFLLRLRDHEVLNAAAYANLVEKGLDPQQALGEWIHPLQDYASHNLRFSTNATYIPVALRRKENPIRDLVDRSVDDVPTAKVVHFFFATPLLGLQTVKAVNILIGLKNAGKSLTLNVVCKVYGSYTMTVPPIDLLPSNETRLVKELFAQQGKRILRVDELNSETYFHEPLIKRITGRDGISNAFVTNPIREFFPQVKFFCDSNAPLKPQIGNESSIADRLFYIPYGKAVPREQRDPYFEATLTRQENLDTYFSWLVDTYLTDVVRGQLS